MYCTLFVSVMFRFDIAYIVHQKWFIDRFYIEWAADNYDANIGGHDRIRGG
jgi:hypothetical protein